MKDDETLLCVIEDDGVGRDKAKELQDANEQLDSHKSLGTKITQKRLEILQNKYSKEVEVVRIIDLFDEKSGIAKGTRVEVLIPILDFHVK